MLRTLILVMALASCLLGQSPPPFNYQISQQPLPIVGNVVANYTGASGQTTNFYFVIARYGVGNASASLPIRVGSIGVGGSVAVSWSAPASPTGYTLKYDVIRSTSNVLGSSCTNCLVASNQAALTATDTLGALSSYTVATYNPNAPVTLALDNINSSTVLLTSAGATLTSSTTGTAANLTFQPFTITQQAQSFTTTPLVDIVGLSYTLAASTSYVFNCYIPMTAIDDMGGVNLQVTYDGTITSNSYWDAYFWTGGAFDVFDHHTIGQNDTQAGGISLPQSVMILGSLVTNGAGTFKVRMAEVAAIGTLTIRRGSTCQMWPVP